MRRPSFSVLFRALAQRSLARVRSRWQYLLALGVALVGLLELALHVYFSQAAPSLPEWQALRPVVVELASGGALIVVAPAWEEPNARFALGDELMPLSHVARPDVSGFERALEISVLGHSAPELEHWRLGAEQRAGRFALRTWINPNLERVRYDFLAHLTPPAAEVRILRKGKEEGCPYGTGKISNGDLHGHPTFPRHRFNCPGGGEWSLVGLTVVEDEQYRPRQCIWAHPANRGTLQIRFDAVPIGSKIRGYGALPYFFERDSHGTPIELSVSVGGEDVGSWKHMDGEGWKPFEFSTARFAGTTQVVEFNVRSKRAVRREFCFQASVR